LKLFSFPFTPRHFPSGSFLSSVDGYTVHTPGCLPFPQFFLRPVFGVLGPRRSLADRTRISVDVSIFPPRLRDSRPRDFTPLTFVLTAVLVSRCSPVRFPSSQGVRVSSFWVFLYFSAWIPTRRSAVESFCAAFNFLFSSLGAQ